MEATELKLRRLEAKRQRLAARIQRLKGVANVQERKRDTRRKILAGAYLIRLMGNDLSRIGARLREAGFLSPRDYSLFGICDGQLTVESVDGTRDADADSAAA